MSSACDCFEILTTESTTETPTTTTATTTKNNKSMSCDCVDPNESKTEVFQLQNPMSVDYLKEHLNPVTPRMILNEKSKTNLLNKIEQGNDVLINMKKALTKSVNKIKVLPLVEHKLCGKRLLQVSREVLFRLNVLCMHHVLKPGNAQVMKRIDAEILAVCNFCDWNPKHYLDTGEMSMAIALAIDWIGHDLPEATVLTAKKALIEKGIMPSFATKQFWMQSHSNWNQVCHGGMIAASVCIADVDPELAAKTIKRALECMPFALQQYAPDGVYPEGSSYWEYGTSYSVLASSILETAFGTDFGIAAYPPLQKSALFRAMTKAPSGWFYNFSDCGDKFGHDGDLVLAYFAAKTGNQLYYEHDRFMRDYHKMAKLNNICGAGIIWLSQFEPCQSCALPTTYHGNGCNPVVIFEDGQYYFGAKGGMASNSHGNMDAGSFVFELDGVRWVVDPGNQRYGTLEAEGFDLWNLKQDSERWTLLTKNNFGHSTLTVNGEHHRVDGMSTIPKFKAGDTPTSMIDMTAAFGGLLKKSNRTFTKDTDSSLIVEDALVLTNKAKEITWQLVTTANVTVTNFGATLEQDGKKLKFELLSEPKVSVTIESLDPPPFKLDRKIDGLKRIDLVFSADMFENKKGNVRVRLSKA